MLSSIKQVDGKVTINGETYVVDKSIAVVNGEVFIDGKKVDGEQGENSNAGGITIVVDGTIEKLDITDSEIGSIRLDKKSRVGQIFVGGDIDIVGDLKGDVVAEGDISIVGDVKGDIQAEGDVSIVGDVRR